MSQPVQRDSPGQLGKQTVPSAVELKPDNEKRDWSDWANPFKNAKLNNEKFLEHHLTERPDRFKGYTTLELPYRRVIQEYKGRIYTLDINVFMLVPESDRNETSPVHVKFHGGGLVTGSGNYEPWWAVHLLESSLRNNAIIIAPNYRTLPEATGPELLSDIDEFWNSWYLGLGSGNIKSFDKIMLDRFPSVQVDKGRVFLSGESAGAIPVIHSWLTQGHKVELKAIYLQYPLLHEYVREVGKDQTTINFMGEDVPLKLIKTAGDAALRELERRKAVGEPTPHRSNEKPPNGMFWALYLSINGKWSERFGAKTMGDRVKQMQQEPAFLPHIYIFHGEQDIVVQPTKTKEWVDVVMEKWPKLKDMIEFHIVDGVGHGFDYQLMLDGNHPYLMKFADGLKKVWGTACSSAAQYRQQRRY